MSINVTVSGNPVRINRGKMVTSHDPTKSEFDKRRFMRLEQVRQQSKDIAENLRNKLKKEKTKCLSEIEKEGEVQLQNWQARKLLELQDQYQEALGEIGLGHKSAMQIEEEEEEEEMERRESNEKMAKERGRIAAERLQIEKNEESLRKAVPIQRKKFTREMENGRGTSLRKNRVKKSKRKMIFDSDGENRVPELALDSDSDSDLVVKENKGQQTSKEKVERGLQTTSDNFKASTRDKGAQTSDHQPVATQREVLAFDTRISERIKRRDKARPLIEYCNSEKKSPCSCCKCPHRADKDHENNTGDNLKPHDSLKIIHPVAKDSQTKPPFSKTSSELFMEIPEIDEEELQKHVQEVSRDNIQDPQKSSSLVQGSRQVSRDSRPIVSKKPEEQKSSSLVPKQLKGVVPKKPEKPKPAVPAKPKTTLRSVKDRPAYIGDPQPAQFYDHPTRYLKSYIPQSHVDTIDAEDIVISPDVLSEDEIREKMRKRDLEAQLRGQAALEKERIQREYQELLRKLPALQKQERICEIGTDKERYHMSKDRLDDWEKKRQNRLDNAYEELFVRHKPAVVTLPKTKESVRPSVNLSNWDVGFDVSRTRTEQLSRLLDDLKHQKDDLLKEIEGTLSKDDVKSKSTDYTRTRKRSRDEDVTRKRSRDEDVTKKSTTLSTVTTVSPSPRKKAKLKSSRKTLILANTSTQTTPKTQESQSVATSPITSTAPPPSVCSCKEDMCEIVIKIKDDEKPEVTVNQSLLHKTKIIREEEGESSKKGISWRQQLTQSSSTSSTSYLEPPSSARSDKSKKKAKSVDSIDTMVKSVSDRGGKKDKSSTSEDTPTKQIDPRLLTYIKKLLNMSRASIDDLTVSAASSVSTPSTSVVETPSNNPLHQLVNVMKYFNLDVADLQQQLTYTSDESSKHYNTNESLTLTSSDGEKSQFQSCTELTTDQATSLQQYADIAASCNRKISNLTAMIEQVRAEKKKMMESSTSGSDRDLTTTSYKDLPDDKKQSDKEKSSSHEDLDKLLAIDYSYAEKLKKMSQAEEKRLSQDELYERMAKLLSTSNKKSPERSAKTVVSVKEKKVVQDAAPTPVAVTTDRKTVEVSKAGKAAGTLTEQMKVQVAPTDVQKDPFPLFLDIPKLPRLEAPSTDKKKKKRPPPTKSLRIVSQGSAPHELSTIIEADSQMSTKIDSPVKPDIVPKEATTSSDDVSELDTMETMLISIGMEWAIPTLKKTREALAMGSSSSGSKESGEISLREFLSRISSSTDKSESEMLSESQGISLIQVDNRRTSTPIVDNKEKKGRVAFMSDSEISSVKEHSGGRSEEKFFDLNEESMSKSR